MATVKLAPDLYTKTPRTAMPGMKSDFRQVALLTTDMITTQIVAIGVVPAMHMLVGFWLECDALDNGGTAAAMTVGLLNSYWNAALASSGAAGWDTGTVPVLATGYNIITAGDVHAAARINPVLAFSNKIGVDNLHDRIIGFTFSTVPTTALAGNVSIIALLDFAPNPPWAGQ